MSSHSQSMTRLSHHPSLIVESNHALPSGTEEQNHLGNCLNHFLLNSIFAFICSMSHSFISAYISFQTTLIRCTCSNFQDHNSVLASRHWFCSQVSLLPHQFIFALLCWDTFIYHFLIYNSGSLPPFFCNTSTQILLKLIFTVLCLWWSSGGSAIHLKSEMHDMIVWCLCWADAPIHPILIASFQWTGWKKTNENVLRCVCAVLAKESWRTANYNFLNKLFIARRVAAVVLKKAYGIHPVYDYIVMQCISININYILILCI